MSRRLRPHLRSWRALCLPALVLAFVVPGAAAASESIAPTRRPVRMIVPVPAGGTSDVLARVIAETLAVELGRPVFVDNRPGATGRIAVDALKHAAPDGATVLLSPITLPVLAPLLARSAGFDPSPDLAPIAQVATYEFALAVPTAHPARSMQEFVAWARSHPEQSAFGSLGAGSLTHLVGSMLAKAADIEFLHVPYKGATSLASELMAGRIAAGISAESDFIALERAGRLRILATSGSQRSRLFPDVPTFGEQGFKSVTAVGWHALYAPAGTSKMVIDQWSVALAAVLQDRAVRERLLAQGLQPTGTTPERLSEITGSDIERWGQIIKANNFSGE